jgi:metal-dependent amidase/aminoacylase/carboxypeptidase family protein
MLTNIHHGTYQRLAGWHKELTAFRRDLHAHPELGFEEVRTAGRIEQALKLAGCDEVHTGVGKTGVVGVIRGDGGGPGAIGLRADMDALPMREENDVPWRSTQAHLMHGCGHDGHMTMLVGAARHLAQTRRFSGTACGGQGDDRGRPVRPVPGRCRLCDAQLAQPAGGHRRREPGAHDGSG